MLKFVDIFGNEHETKLLKKNKSKNLLLNFLAIILCIVFFAYLYCYNEYFAGWYYDSLPLQNRNFLNYIIDVSLLFVPLIIITILIISFIPKISVSNEAKNIINDAKKQARKGFYIKSANLESLKNNILENYVFDERFGTFRRIFSNGLFSKKVESIVMVEQYEGYEKSKEKINSVIDNIQSHETNSLYQCIGIIFYGQCVHQEIDKLILNFRIDDKIKLNVAFVDFNTQKAYAFSISDIYSKEFCLHSQTIVYLL